MRNNSRGFIQIILIFVVIVAVGIGAYYFGTQKGSFSLNSNPTAAPVVSTQPTVTPSPSGTLVQEGTAGWKTYKSSEISLKYPPNFSVEMGSAEYFGGETVVIKNPKKTVTLTIYPAKANTFTYGFGGDVQKTTKQISNVNFDGQNLVVKETTVDGPSKFIDFVNKNNYSFMYGTGYPASDSSLTLLEDYEADKKTFFQILSTFKFSK